MVNAEDRPFRFYDNRQKYLAFVTTCDEKWQIAKRASDELANVRPTPPSLRVFDAGVGDGTVLTHLMRSMHARFPNAPFYVVGKEISLEDVRLTLEKLPDRLVEHPDTVFVLTNLHYSEAPTLCPNTEAKRDRLMYRRVELSGSESYTFGEQLRDLDPFLVKHWEVKPSKTTGNPLYVHPTVLVINRKDHSFALDSVIPAKGGCAADYDLIIASQPWRSRTAAEFKVDKILAPMARSLRSHGSLLGIQSAGDDPGLELIRRLWPGEDPFPVDRYELLEKLRIALGSDARKFDLLAFPDDESRLTFSMHTLPDEIETNIGTSTLFAAWNAAIYVAQMEDRRIDEVMADNTYLKSTADVLREYGGLWFHDETFVVRRL